MVRIDEDLGTELTRLTNQVRDLVYRSAPGLLALSPAADDAWVGRCSRTLPRRPISDVCRCAASTDPARASHSPRDGGRRARVLQTAPIYTAPA